MIIHVTAEDIQEFGYKARNNPITRAVQRETKQQWIVFDGRTAHELTPPYRSIHLPAEVADYWHNYQATGEMSPFNFEFTAYPLTSTSAPANTKSSSLTSNSQPVQFMQGLDANRRAISSQRRATAVMTLEESRPTLERRRQERRQGERRSYHDRRRGSRANALV
ncbi:MAG: hypothetical protein JO316_11115 [Abitibacteriaceae bacterium]|nr:hypothetical protein [Abditibacteriaceae bacterium]MBV9865895.1 hypothetical protein [Abditibacteriaceae bacterium]